MTVKFCCICERVNEKRNLCTPLIQNKQLHNTRMKLKFTKRIGFCNIAKIQEFQFKSKIVLKYDGCNI